MDHIHLLSGQQHVSCLTPLMCSRSGSDMYVLHSGTLQWRKFKERNKSVHPVCVLRAVNNPLCIPQDKHQSFKQHNPKVFPANPSATEHLSPGTLDSVHHGLAWLPLQQLRVWSFIKSHIFLKNDQSLDRIIVVQKLEEPQLPTPP